MKPIYSQINQYLDYCEHARNMSPATMRAKRSIYHRFAEVIACDNLKKLTNADFDRWTRYGLSRGASPRSINAYNANIIAMLNYYREMGMKIPLKSPLVHKLKEGEVRRSFYTRSQIREVLRYANPTTALMIKICFDSGMRIAELTNLKLANIHENRINFVGKGNKPREVYLSDGTMRLLQEYIKRHQIKNYLWPSPRNSGVERPLTVHAVRKRLRQPFYRAGYIDFYPHSLRHSFATDLEFRGASVAEIQQMIGHFSIATTERYVHALDGHLAELFAKYR